MFQLTLLFITCLGLFLGYTILQAPWMFFEFCSLLARAVRYVRFRRERKVVAQWRRTVVEVHPKTDSKTEANEECEEIEQQK